GWQGDLDQSRAIFRELEPTAKHVLRAEFHLEVADLEAELGDLDLATRWLRALAADHPPRQLQHMAASAEALVLIRQGQFEQSRRLVESFDPNEPTPEPGRQSRLRAIRSLAATLGRDADAGSVASEASAFARQQESARHRAMAELCLATIEQRLSDEILGLPTSLLAVLSAS